MWLSEADARASLLKGDSAGAGDGMLQEYSNEFLRLRQVAASRLAAMLEDPADSNSSQEAKAAEKALEEMESNRRQAQVELKLKMAAGPERKEWEARLQEWAREVARMRSQLDELREAQARRALGLSGGVGSLEMGLTPEHRSALQSTDTLDRASQKLEEARQQALDSEAISEGVMSDLSAQRETIMRARESMRTVGGELSSASRSIHRMIGRATRNQLITSAVTVLVAVGLTVWLAVYLRLPSLMLEWPPAWPPGPAEVCKMVLIAAILAGMGYICVRCKCVRRLCRCCG